MHRQTSSIRRIEYQNWNVSRLALQLSLRSLLKQVFSQELRCGWSSADDKGIEHGIIFARKSLGDSYSITIVTVFSNSRNNGEMIPVNAFGQHILNIANLKGNVSEWETICLLWNYVLGYQNILSRQCRALGERRFPRLFVIRVVADGYSPHWNVVTEASWSLRSLASQLFLNRLLTPGTKVISKPRNIICP